MTRRRPPGAAGGWHRLTPSALVEDRERPVVGLDRAGGHGSDARHDDDLWDPAIAAFVPRPSAVLSLLAGVAAGAVGGVILGLILGWAIASAAPRPAATVIPAGVAWSGTPQASSSENLSQPTTAPRATLRSIDPGATAGPDALRSVTFEGKASWMPERFGRDYLAMREKRGTVVTICGPGGCWRHAVVNDYGPSSRIRPTRVADVAVGRWESMCGVPRRFGLCDVVVTVERRPGLAPAAPPTDHAP